jgi:prepilin-type N-terminal cleavage/methylation domain-containing protein
VMRLHGKISGFTMIEMVVAIAVASLLVVVITSTTHSMKDVADRQRQRSVTFKRNSAFVDTLKRDLRGWIHCDDEQKVSGQPATMDIELFEFSTVADSLRGTHSDFGGPARGIRQLKYVVRPVDGFYSIVRIECAGDEEPFELSLVSVDFVPKVEFYDGRKWTAKWKAESRPEIIRLDTTETKVVFRL